MAARLVVASSKDVMPAWDKALLVVFLLLAYSVVYWIAGRAYGPPLPIDVAAILGTVIYLLSSMLTGWVLSENRYAEAVSRVREKRDQRVCNTGPSAFVRHPMHFAIAMWCISVITVFV